MMTKGANDADGLANMPIITTFMDDDRSHEHCDTNQTRA